MPRRQSVTNLLDEYIFLRLDPGLCYGSLHSFNSVSIHAEVGSFLRSKSRNFMSRKWTLLTVEVLLVFAFLLFLKPPQASAI